MINATMVNFYLNDRLGSVRQIIDTSGNVKNRYTYRPFGETYDDEGEVEETITNPFMFTGQYFDSEIDEYYLRARQYDPHIGRFTSRDSVFGKFKEPMTLHRYLYCINDPVNNTDLSGESMLVDVTKSTALRTFVFNSLISRLRGNDWRTSLIHGGLGVVGYGAGQMIFASLSSAHIWAQALGPYSVRIAKMIGSASGGGMATIAKYYGQPGEQDWKDTQFLADLVGSLVLNAVIGAGPGEGINPQWFNDVVDFSTFVSWNWFVDNVIPKLEEWTKEKKD